MSNVPAELLYTKSHEWARKADGLWLVGLTDHAQSTLGGIVFVNLPEVGDPVEVGAAFADVESVKATSDVFSPVKGTVRAVNEELLDSPERINDDPYGAWLVKIEGEAGDLLDAEGYRTFVASEEA